MATLPVSRQGPCHDGISLICFIAIWHEVVRLLAIAGVELPHVDCVLGFLSQGD
jgi:hypothetical protein